MKRFQVRRPVVKLVRECLLRRHCLLGKSSTYVRDEEDGVEGGAYVCFPR